MTEDEINAKLDAPLTLRDLLEAIGTVRAHYMPDTVESTLLDELTDALEPDQ